MSRYDLDHTNYIVIEFRESLCRNPIFKRRRRTYFLNLELS